MLTPVVLTPPPGLTSQRLAALEQCLSSDAASLSEIEAQTRLRTEVAGLWPELPGFAAEIRTHLNSSRGAVLVERLPFWYDERYRDAVYLSLSLLIGSPVTHDRMNVLFDIAPQSTLPKFPTYSETRDEVPFHTDGTFRKSPPHYIGFLVLKQAVIGGEILLADGEEACLHWQDTPEGTRALRALQYEYPYRVPDLYRHPDAWTSVIRGVPLTLSPFQLRYRPDVLLAGLARIGQTDNFPLPRAVNAFRDHLETVPQQVLGLEAGSLLFLDNHRILHGRKAFQGERLLRRVWMI